MHARARTPPHGVGARLHKDGKEREGRVRDGDPCLPSGQYAGAADQPEQLLARAARDDERQHVEDGRHDGAQVEAEPTAQVVQRDPLRLDDPNLLGGDPSRLGHLVHEEEREGHCANVRQPVHE
eukprot:2848112-Pleurochrysis_carterae.AAC.1